MPSFPSGSTSASGSQRSEVTRRGFLGSFFWGFCASRLSGSSLVALLPAFGASGQEARLGVLGQEYCFHHDHVMGTSLDLVMHAVSARQANAAHAAMFDEIERLCKVLSTYDPASEISRLNAASGNFTCSSDLFHVLAAYEQWRTASGGAISAQMGGMIRAWKQAEAEGRLPEPYAAESGAANQSLLLDAASRTITCKFPGLLNIDALGKAYIADRAADRAFHAGGVNGLLLNIGGDIVMRGSPSRIIAVADPANPADNARPFTQVRMNATEGIGAIATSGSSERRYRIDGRSYSHLLNPRTGQPATGASSATVIAADGVTANALATALCILPADEGLQLVNHTPAAAALLIAPDGAVHRSERFTQYERPSMVSVAQAAGWQPGYEVSVMLTLKEIPGINIRRPFVAVWAEDSNKKLIRTITVWANKPRWMPDLETWWFRAGAKVELFNLTKPTRPPGHYRIVWDGLDDHGQPVPAGTYRINVETNREHGNYEKKSGDLDCGSKTSEITLKKTSEFEEVLITYGPRQQVS